MIKKIILITLLSLLSLAACDKKDNNNNQDIHQDSFDDISNLKLGELSPKDSFSLDEINVSYFTVSDNGEIYATSEEIALARFSRQGDLIEKYENAGSLSYIYYYNNKIYAYDQKKNCIVAYDLSAKRLSKISDKFDIEISRIKNLFVVDDTVYALIIPMFLKNDDEVARYGKPDENGFIDYNEKLYSINISDGKMTDLNIDNIITVYKSASGDIFYYAYKDKSYGLFHFDKGTGEGRKIADMNDVGYIETFIYEGNNFTYLLSNSLYNKDFHNGEITLLEQDINLAFTSKAYLYSGHLIYLEYQTDTADSVTSQKSKVTSRYIGDIYMVKDANSSSATDTYANENDKITKRSGSLVISADPNYPVIDLTYFNKYTGIRGRIKEPPVDQIQFLTEIMAGNDEVDIYMLWNTYLIDRLVDMSFYVPLNKSDSISKYVSGCFDNIASYVKSDNGEIWGIPLSTNTSVIIYVPENFKRFNLDQDDVKYYTSFMDTLKRLNKADSNCRVVTGHAETFFFTMLGQYSVTYNDYENKKINFKTDLFRSLFTLLDGYEFYKGENHPLFLSHLDYRYRDNLGIDHYHSNYPEKVIFKVDSISNFLHPIASDSNNYSLSDWRIFPMTRLSKDVKHDFIGLDYAIINPNSKKKDDALFYLEAFVRDPHDALASSYCNFTQKDISSYKKYYDTNLPVFSDIYNIMKDGVIITHPIPAISNQFVDDYQKGRLSLNEAIDYIQREYEMALNE